MFLARQEASREMLARLSAPIAVPAPRPRRRHRSPVLKAAMIAALLGTGWFAFHVVEFHPPTSLADALPRL